MKKNLQRQIINKAVTAKSLRMTTTVIIALVLRFAGTGEARADENPDTATLHIDAEQIVVTATKTAKELSGVTASAEVIAEKEIQRMGAANLKDIFEKTPGTILQYGTFPSASSASKSSVSFRGIGASGSLFLVDGRRLAGEVKNPYDLDRIPAAMIERIEIIKGPMSVLYGADALGGVINIITKKPEKGAAGSVGLRAGANTDGDDARINGNIALGGKTGKFGYSVLVNAMHTKPYTANRAYINPCKNARRTCTAVTTSQSRYQTNSGQLLCRCHVPGKIRSVYRRGTTDI